MTVVVEFSGTITVVRAGGGGLLLLMQPDSMPAAIKKAARIFIVASRCLNDPANLESAGALTAVADGSRPHEPIAIARVVPGPTGLVDTVSA
jgi:hypothetical protein